MHRSSLLLAFLLVQACETPSDPLAGVDLAAPPINVGLDLQTQLLSPGLLTTFTMSGMTPGATGFLLGSTVGTGTGSCPGSLGGACIDLVRPFFLGSAVANGAGIASFFFTVPPNAPVGLLPCFQGAEIVPGQPADLSIPACSYVRACSPADVTVDFTNIGTFQAGLVAQGPVEVRGSAQVNVLNFNGLGIVGGNNSNTVDGAETIEFAFSNGPKRNVRYFVGSAGNLDGNGTVGDRVVEAFSASGSSFGTLLQTSVGVFGVSNNPDDLVESFLVEAQVDSFRVAQVIYEDCL